MSTPKSLREPLALRLTSNGFLVFWCLLAAFPLFWIAVMSFKGLVMFPIAVAFAFQMLTAVAFYQLFLKTLPTGGPQDFDPRQKVK